MEINEKYKNSLKLLVDNEKIKLTILEKLLENCCNVLGHKKEIYDVSTLCKEHPNKIKEIYASLLYIYTDFARNNHSKEEFFNFLINKCNLDKEQAKLCENFYEKSKKEIRLSLLNIGAHLPHVTDVKWKIDYIVKSNSIDQSEGPIFRVSLKTEKYDEKIHNPKVEFFEFTCTSQELQDLVYKLKDAVRHCQKLATEH